MTKKTIHNVITGEINEVDLTAEEETLLQEKIEANNNKIIEHQNKIDEQATLKASTKAKLIVGEKLTEEEANILVGV